MLAMHELQIVYVAGINLIYTVLDKFEIDTSARQI
jgi:hypothetical protein